MILSDLSTLILELLEVDDDRYPSAVRTMHINQAIGEMAQATDFPFDNFVETAPVMSGTEISLGSIVTGKRVIRVKSIKHDDAALSPVLPTELNVDSGVTPTEFAHFGMSLFLDGDASLMVNPVITGRSKPVTLSLSSDENLWTQYIPYAVAYQACIIASVWLVEEERSIVFRQLLADVLHGASVEYMMDVEEVQTLESL